MRPSMQRLLDLLGEQPLAADLGERAILHLVAGGADRLDQDRVGLGKLGINGDEALAHDRRLLQSERAAARADSERKPAGRHGPKL